MTKKYEDFQSFYHKGKAGFWDGYGYNETGITKTDERGYEATFRYENFESRIELDAQKDADYRDWKRYIEQCERAKKNIDSQNISGQNKQDNQPVDLNQGFYNQILNRIKAIDTNIQKTIPEKVADMREMMQEIEKNNKEITDAQNDKLNQVNDSINDIGSKLNQAKEEGDDGAITQFIIQLQDLQNQLARIADDKSKFEDLKTFKDYLERQETERNKWFWEKLDLQEPRTYRIISIYSVILISVILLIALAINWFKSLFKRQ